MKFYTCLIVNRQKQKNFGLKSLIRHANANNLFIFNQWYFPEHAIIFGKYVDDSLKILYLWPYADRKHIYSLYGFLLLIMNFGKSMITLFWFAFSQNIYSNKWNIDQCEYQIDICRLYKGYNLWNIKYKWPLNGVITHLIDLH